MLTAEEQAMIVERLIFAGKRGFAVRKDALKSIMMQIASDGSPSLNKRAQTDDKIMAFRALRRELTFRKSEYKDMSKLR